MVSTLGSNWLMLVGIVTLVVASAQAEDVPAAEEATCNIKHHVTSCDGNNMQFSIVLDGEAGDKFIINHNVERIPAPTPTNRPRRTKKPRIGPKGETVSIFPGLWREKIGAWKEKMKLMITRRRAKMRRQKKRLMRPV